jgi:hypothetical protein
MDAANGTGVLRFAQDEGKNKQRQKRTTTKTSNSKNKQRQEQKQIPFGMTVKKSDRKNAL